MRKSEAFDIVVNEIAKICEVDINELTSATCKGHPIVDARILCTQFLWRMGFSNDEIAYYVLTNNRKIQGITTESQEVTNKAKHINKLLNSYNERCRDFMFRQLATSVNEFVVRLMRENETPTQHTESV